MTPKNISMDVDMDAREVMHDVILHLKLTNMWFVWVGVFFIRLGCLISGIKFDAKLDTSND